MKRIGILGGTFNPVHIGHLLLAEQARQLLKLEKVIFVPVNLPPHKRTKLLLSSRRRCQLLVRAIKSNPAFGLSDIEVRRGGLSYSVQTIKEFKSIYGRARLYFIVGADSLRDFSTWKQISEIRKNCQIVVAKRPGYPIKRLPRNMLALDLPLIDISSSQIRRRIRRKQSIRYLVPEQIRKQILAFYQNL